MSHPRLCLLAPRTAVAFVVLLATIAVGLPQFLGCSRTRPISDSGTASLHENEGPEWFEDVSDAWGFDFTHDPGPLGTYFTPQSMGSGAAVFDFDGDGLLDIYMLHFGGPNSKSVNKLFRQVSPGKFVDVTAGSGLGVSGYSHGVAIGDVNNDGLPDVLLTQFDGIKLFLNMGGGKFRDATAESGLANLSWGMSAAFLDYNRDGWLDLVVINYLDFDPSRECWSLTGKRDYCGPRNFSPVTSKLFRNLGAVPGEPGKPPGVRFKDVSFESGIGRVAGAGLGVVCADFNGDGWPDIFVANDGNPNRLWINKKDGTFVDEAVSRNVAYTEMGKAYAGMGVAIGDVNNDGLLDLYVTHLGSESNNLWRQGPRGQFRDKTAETGLLGTKWHGTGFGTLMADFNNDGWIDIAVANGRVFTGGDAKDTGMGFWEPYLEKNQLLANDGTGKFRDISLSNQALCGYWNVARGLVAADFDNDGGVDLLVAPLGGKARIFRNVVPNRGNWVKIRAFDPKLNRDAYGAEIRVRAGGKEYLRVVNPAESYLCSSSPLAHFGLGPTDTIESIRVTWPDGETLVNEIFPGGPAGRTITVLRGKGIAP
jgi:enediyne biosynthesis protein E4